MPTAIRFDVHFGWQVVTFDGRHLVWFAFRSEPHFENKALPLVIFVRFADLPRLVTYAPSVGAGHSFTFLFGRWRCAPPMSQWSIKSAGNEEEKVARWKMSFLRLWVPECLILMAVAGRLNSTAIGPIPSQMQLMTHLRLQTILELLFTQN